MRGATYRCVRGHRGKRHTSITLMPITHHTHARPGSGHRRCGTSRTRRHVRRRRGLLLLRLRCLGLVVVGFFAAKEAAEAFFDLGEGVGCY